MRFHDRPMIADFAAALSQIPDQLFATIQLRAGRLIAIEIADQTNPQRDVVQIITVDMAAVDLPAPPVADLDLAVTGRRAVADHKMVSQSVLHSTKMAVVIIERGCVALSRSAVVDNDVLPATSGHRRTIDLSANRSRQISITAPAAAASSAAPK